MRLTSTVRKISDTEMSHKMLYSDNKFMAPISRWIINFEIIDSQAILTYLYVLEGHRSDSNARCG